MKKTRQVVMLPTDNYSDIVHSTSKYGGLFESRHYSPMKDMGDSYQHIYITSDEDIKEGDYFYSSTANKVSEPCTESDAEILSWLKKCKKIIATTDSSLSLPLLSQQFIKDFIKAYNNGNPITEVEVEYENEITPNPKFNRAKGVSSKNPTYLEIENLKPKTNSDNTIIIHSKEESNYDKAIKEIPKDIQEDVKRQSAIIDITSCMLSILDSLKLYDNNSLILDKETLSEMMFRKMEAYNIDLNKLLGFTHLKPVLYKEEEKMYSREEVEKLLHTYGEHAYNKGVSHGDGVDKWIEKNL